MIHALTDANWQENEHTTNHIKISLCTNRQANKVLNSKNELEA